MIKVEDLVKDYRTGRYTVHALKGVSFELDDCGFTFILGKSGCGKSTLLNAIGALDVCDGGKITVDGREIAALSEREKDDYRCTEVGTVFQEHRLLEKEKAVVNVEIPARLAGRGDARDMALRALERVGLADLAERKVYELSGGQKQRVAIARAIVNSPKIILADEPTGNLDSAAAEDIFRLLTEISKDTCVIVVTHDRRAVEKYGDRVMRMKDGAIVSDEIRGSGRAQAQCRATDGRGIASRVRMGTIRAAQIARSALTVLGNRSVRVAVMSAIFVVLLAIAVADMSYLLTDKASLYVKNALSVGEDYVFLSGDGELKQSVTGRDKKGLAAEFPEIRITELFNFGTGAYLYDSNVNAVNGRKYSFGHLAVKNSDSDPICERYVAGRSPLDMSEVAVSYAVYTAFSAAGLAESSNGLTWTKKEISSPEDMLGVRYGGKTICGVYDSGADEGMLESIERDMSFKTAVGTIDPTLFTMIDQRLGYSKHGVVIVADSTDLMTDNALSMIFGGEYGYRQSVDVGLPNEWTDPDEIYMLADGLGDGQICLQEEVFDTFYANYRKYEDPSLPSLEGMTAEEKLKLYRACGPLELALYDTFEEGVQAVLEVAGFHTGYADSFVNTDTYEEYNDCLGSPAVLLHPASDEYTDVVRYAEKIPNTIRSNILAPELLSIQSFYGIMSEPWMQGTILALTIVAAMILFSDTYQIVRDSRSETGIMRSYGLGRGETAGMFALATSIVCGVSALAACAVGAILVAVLNAVIGAGVTAIVISGAESAILFFSSVAVGIAVSVLSAFVLTSRRPADDLPSE